MPDEVPPAGFEWDAAKAAGNRRKHGVTFDQAAVALAHPRALTGPDAAHSAAEPRELTFAPGPTGRLLAIAHTRRGAQVRLISARRANAREERRYERAIGGLGPR
jgi:uncharacterized DUF497 family protein